MPSPFCGRKIRGILPFYTFCQHGQWIQSTQVSGFSSPRWPRTGGMIIFILKAVDGERLTMSSLGTIISPVNTASLDKEGHPQPHLHQQNSIFADMAITNSQDRIKAYSTCSSAFFFTFFNFIAQWSLCL